MIRLTAAILLLALPAACMPEKPSVFRKAHAQVQTPGAGYHGLTIPQAALHAAEEVRRTQAERARDRKLQHALSRISPAAGDDKTLWRPHILQIGARHRNSNLADAKHPIPAQPFGAADRGRGLVPFSITTVQKAMFDREFDDRPSCEAAARWWLENVLDPETDAVVCMPRGTGR